MLRKTNYVLTTVTACVIAAAVTVGILNFAAETAKMRLAGTHVTPDYVRYLSQGYAFDTVTTKKTYLLTVTDGELPVRIHLLTLDVNKHTLDVLELPPNSFAIADGFSGTLRDAFKTPVYKDIISMSLCLKIDGCASFSAEAFGGCAELLGVSEQENAARSALDGGSYSRGDVNAVKEYREYLSKILCEMPERGALESFTLLMNLIANCVDTRMSVRDIAEAANFAKGVTAENMQIHIAPGFAAKFGGEVIWVLDSEAVADLLNERFRARGAEYPRESLSIPEVKCEEFPYAGLSARVTDII